MPSARVSTSLSAITYKSWPAATIPRGASRSSSASPVAATRAAGASIETRFMSARSFFDTNVLVYSDDKRGGPITNAIPWAADRARVEKP